MLIALILAAAAPQTAPPPPPAPPKVDCTDADHRAFDFWIGEWNVFDTASKTWIANSRIEKVVGCAIAETYDQFVGPTGKRVDYHGRSISAFVPADKVWRQYYVDNAGTAMTLTGGIGNGSMVLLSSPGPLASRMTLRIGSDGSVRQFGESSNDGGKTWTPSFDFTYRRSNAIAGVVTMITRRTYHGVPTRKVSRRPRK